jgi:hypothetical protein
VPQCRLSIHTFKKYVCHAKSGKKRVYKKKYAKNVAKKKITYLLHLLLQHVILTDRFYKKKEKKTRVSVLVHSRGKSHYRACVFSPPEFVPCKPCQCPGTILLEVKVTIERAFSPPQNLYRAKPLRLQRWREKFFFASICTVLTPSALNGKKKNYRANPLRPRRPV